MRSSIVTIDARRIVDWPSFHDVFAEAMGFPAFYGRNLDAWIDCMTSLDSPPDGLTVIHVVSGGMLVLTVEHADDFAMRCPDQYRAIMECAAIVNGRHIRAGREPVLAIAF